MNIWITGCSDFLGTRLAEHLIAKQHHVTGLSRREPFSILNLGCGQRLKTSEWAHALVDALASKSDIIPVDRATSDFDLYADISAARQQIAFAPMSLDESMKIYAAELRA